MLPISGPSVPILPYFMYGIYHLIKELLIKTIIEGEELIMATKRERRGGARRDNHERLGCPNP